MVSAVKSSTLKKKRKKAKVLVPKAGIVHVLSTYNNNIVTVTDVQGNAIGWSSSGASGFSGSRKATNYAAQVTVGNAVKLAHELGMKTVDVIVRGPGSGREAAIRAVANFFHILSMRYYVSLSHNGVRPPKRRRV